MPLLLALLLAACDGGDAPTAARSSHADAPTAGADAPTADAAGQAAAPAERVELFRVIVRADDHTATAVRAFDDGTVEQGVGSPDALAWRATRRLTATSLAELRELLGAPELAHVPADLPAPPDARGPSATWRFLVPGADEAPATLRTITSASYLAVRVPTLERVEQLLSTTSRSTAVHTRWTVQRKAGAVVVELPCDPMQVARIRNLVTALHDPRMQPVEPPDVTDEPLLRIDFAAGTRSWQTTLLADGAVLRRDETGARRAARLGPHDLPMVKAEVVRIPWDEVTCPP